MTPEFPYAQSYVSVGGLSVLPVKRDGTKEPDTEAIKNATGTKEWTLWKQRRPSLDEIICIWDPKSGIAPGIAIIGGKVSDGLCILDFESSEIFERWKLRMSPEMLAECSIVKSPRGYHVYFRSTLQIGCRKLARKDKKTTLIETKAEGGYVLAPGSPAECHPLNIDYRLIQGDPLKIPVISSGIVERFLEAAESFNEYIEPVKHYQLPQQIRPAGNRPGDVFDARIVWNLILQPHGWKACRGRGQETRWRRPGGSHYTSAVTNHFGKDELIVFSTEAHPFETEKAYTKFAAFTLLNFAGDFHAAAKTLAAKGYGN